MSTTSTNIGVTRERGPARGHPSCIDTERYPLHRPDSRERGALVESCRRQLDGVGACVLDGFVTAAGIERILTQIDPLHDRAFVCSGDHNAYLAGPDPRFHADHPRNRCVQSQKGCLAYDQIPGDSPLRELYDWDAFRGFIAEVMGYEELYPYDDPLGSINVNFYDRGQQIGWHFDNASFVITLMLRTVDLGGVYEFIPHLRTDDDQGFEAVGRLLGGDRSGVRELSQDAGALVLFRGSRSIHRVTPNETETSRTIAILSYSPQPGYLLTERTREIFYGRVA